MSLFIQLLLFIIILFVIRFLPSIISHFLPKQNFRKKYSSNYAVVTGATSGIGFCITKELISQGFHVLMIGLPSDISQEEIPNSTRIESDLSLDSTINSISEFIRTYKPSLFIHCAGAMTMDNFHSYDKPEKYISTFITSTVKLTQVFIQNNQNNKCGIVFMSSCVSYFSTPFGSLYASTKSFVSQFVRSLNVEYPNIHFLCLHPGAVNNTGFFSRMPSFFFFDLVKCLGQTPDIISDLVFKCLGRITSVDTGVYTFFTRFLSEIIDPNIMDFFIGLFGFQIRNTMKKQLEK